MTSFLQEHQGGWGVNAVIYQDLSALEAAIQLFIVVLVLLRGDLAGLHYLGANLLRNRLKKKDRFVEGKWLPVFQRLVRFQKFAYGALISSPCRGQGQVLCTQREGQKRASDLGGTKQIYQKILSRIRHTRVVLALGRRWWEDGSLFNVAHFYRALIFPGLLSPIYRNRSGIVTPRPCEWYCI